MEGNLKPILKYRGGKSKEIKYFEKLIPKFERYVEPFMGGGALYFYLEPDKALLNDINEKLTNFYRSVQDDYPIIRKELDYLGEVYAKNRLDFLEKKSLSPDLRVSDWNESLYYKLRDQYNGLVPEEYHKATLYYFINKTAYSGMIRFNNKGEFNVPYGRYANFNTKLLNDEHHKLLKKAKIINGSYIDIFQQEQTTDFIFLDPPYDTVFSDYGNETFTGDFREEEHRLLASDFKNLSANTMMIIGDTPLIRELYSDYIFESYKKKYSVNIRNRFKVETEHLIITNYLK